MPPPAQAEVGLRMGHNVDSKRHSKIARQGKGHLGCGLNARTSVETFHEWLLISVTVSPRPLFLLTIINNDDGAMA